MIVRFAALALALLAPAAARAEWHEASTEHFVVYADSKPETISKFADELEKFNKAMRAFYRNVRKPAEGPANRVTVFVVSASDGIAKLAGSGFVRGFYIPRAGGNVAFVPPVAKADRYELSGIAVLRHEYAHHFMYTAAPAVFPMWFSEGFAEFWSTVRFEKDGGATIGIAPSHRGWGLMSGNPLPVEQLVTMTSRRLNPEQLEAIYGRGWLLTHYLMSDPARQKLLGKYIAALNEGQAPTKAAEAFGDLKALGRELEKYLNRRTLPATTLSAETLATAPVKLRKLTPGEVATMKVRIESRAGVTPDEAKQVLIKARKAAAPYPNDPGAQVALAEAEYDAGNYALADEASGRAITAAPTMSDALVYRAMSKLALAEAADKPDWSSVRRAIVAANRADPEDPRPLILFYRSFIAAGQAPTEAAKLGFAKAYDIAPSDMGLRMDAARMFLMDGNRTEAREALRLIAFNPHGATRAEFARTMVAAIDNGDTPDKILAMQPAADTKDDGE
ncbi:hypothetical protein M9978_04390 [Sphingomonas sp. MG17]|uniref:DUF1570 domain-containing protein n=1 Tax=Sphingomonas tagetis TaxID=2949092 RepID=A0A9X2HPL8_9SPHN|nr:hypothetical protein [Sphingomonas tagetis]MCP3729660.1 hypothetical protein [Sphingomonas tagetis]